jgi:hypothetical protein
MLRRRGAEFSVERSATQYLALVEQLLGAAARS